MKNFVKITLIVLVVAVPLVILALPSSGELRIDTPDNHYLNDAKTMTSYQLIEVDGKIVEAPYDLYEKEMLRRAAPAGEWMVEELTKRGVSRKKAEKLTVGQYEDYIYNLPMDEDYIKLMEHYGVKKEEYSEWTNMDAENFLYNKNKKALYREGRQYTDEQLEQLNATGITLSQYKTLMNMSFDFEEIVKMTSQEIEAYTAQW